MNLRDQKQIEEIRAMREVGFRPIMQCPRCLGGQVVRDGNGKFSCIQCSAEHTADGELIELRVAQGIYYERGAK